MRHSSSSSARACALALAIGFGSGAMAQQPGYPDPYQQQPQPQPQPQEPQPQQPQTDLADPYGTPPVTPPPDLTPPGGDSTVTQPQPGLEVGTDQPPPEVLLDGHVRSGPFLAGPGSLTFIVHNSFLGAVGGFGTQLLSSRFDFTRGKEGMLVGTLVGAGIGFGISTWWQFTHWMDQPVSALSVVNGAYAGMLAAGLTDSLSNDLTALAWSSFISAELGAWLTAVVAGGEMPLADGLAMMSAGAWAAAYTALTLATLTYSGGVPPRSKAWVDALLLAPGLGAVVMAVALQQIHPTTSQVLRGDILGFGLGAVVLVVSGFVVGFETTTTYVLAALTSALALAAVSIFWEEAAETPTGPESARVPSSRRNLASKRPYNNPWW